MTKYILTLTLLFPTFLVSLISINTSHAQQYHTLYWMQGIPQSTFANPGLQPRPNYFVGLPGISSIYTGVSHSGFAPYDLIKKSSDSTFYIDDRAMLAKLKNRNFLTFDLNVDILGFGFRTKKKNYFTFNISEKVTTKMGYTRDLMRFVIEGNDGFANRGETANIGLLTMDMAHYREFAAGFSRKWTDQLTAGARLKYLQGMGNVQFKRSDLDIFTNPDNYHILLNANLLVNKSFPVQLAPLENISEMEEIEFTDEDMIAYLTNTQNMGFAMDFGASFALDEKFTFAASILDLGFINWRSDVENFAATSELDFKGLDFDQFFISEDDDDPFAGVVDSILDLFDIRETTNAYRMNMTPKIFVSAAYSLTTMHRFALLGRGEIFDGTLYPSVTLSYNFQPINRFGSTLSYSIIHGNIYNFGFGAHVNIFPVQIYLVLDNYFPALQPHTFQNFHVHFGVNIAAGFGRKQDLTAPSFRWY